MTGQFIGKVVSNRMMKSVVVAVDYLRKIPKYHEIKKGTSKIMAHDELNECNIGDMVRIASCRPLSKRKAFRVTDILKRARVIDQETISRIQAESAKQLAALKEESERRAAEDLARKRQLEAHAKEVAEKNLEEYKHALAAAATAVSQQSASVKIEKENEYDKEEVVMGEGLSSKIIEEEKKQEEIIESLDSTEKDVGNIELKDDPENWN